MVYVPQGERTVTIDTSRLSGETLVAWWYSPSTGAAIRTGSFAREGSRTFTTPAGDDWVLVLDDAARSYVAPGKAFSP
jgi:Putative collagen-binding domain of a collagenase